MKQKLAKQSFHIEGTDLHGVAVDKHTNYIYVSDINSRSIKVIHGDTVAEIKFETNDFIPFHLLIDQKRRRLYVCSTNRNEILAIQLQTVNLSHLTSIKLTTVSKNLTKPRGMCLDLDGNLLICDGHAIKKVWKSKRVTVVAGNPKESGSKGGSCLASRFYQPMGINVASDGSIYVTDYWNNSLRKIDVLRDQVTSLFYVHGPREFHWDNYYGQFYICTEDYVQRFSLNSDRESKYRCLQTGVSSKPFGMCLDAHGSILFTNKDKLWSIDIGIAFHEVIKILQV